MHDESREQGQSPISKYRFPATDTLPDAIVEEEGCGGGGGEGQLQTVVPVAVQTQEVVARV